MRFVFFLLLFFVVSHHSISQLKSTCFIENSGQIIDEDGKYRADVIATFNSPRGLFVIRNSGYSFIEYKYEKIKISDKNEHQDDILENKKTAINKIDVNWSNCNLNPTINFSKQTKTKINFYNARSEKPVLNVSTFEEIYLKNIYEGIDVRFYFKDGNLEYDYIVTSSENLKNLEIEVKGGKYSLLQNGDLCIKSNYGNIIESAPKVYQNKKEIESFWVLIGDCKAKFKLKKVEKHAEIIIDPIIREWATYLGAENGVLESDIKCDSEGNVLFVGKTFSWSNMVPLNFGNITGSSNLLSDAFFAKYDRQGNILQLTIMGGERDDSYSRISINDADAFICLGSTSSTTNVGQNGEIFSLNNDFNNVSFISFFNELGQLVWTKYYKKKLGEITGDLNNEGEIVISSLVNSPNLATLGAFQEELQGVNDYLLTKLNVGGEIIWSTYYGGENDESLSYSYYDNEDNIFLIGGTNSETLISTADAYQVNKNGFRDAFIAKFDENGNRIWASYFGGNLDDIIYSGFVDGKGNAYLVGESSSDSLLINSTAFQSVNKGGYDGLIGKFSPNGDLLWATYYGDSLHEEFRSIEVDNRGFVWVGGFSNSYNLSTPDGFQVSQFDSIVYPDLLLAKFDSLGNRLWATYYGGENIEYFGHLSLGIEGEIYLSACTQSTQNISSNNAMNDSINGYIDYFIVKFKDEDWNLGLEEIASNEDVLFPNPAMDLISIKNGNNSIIKSVKIYDFLGKLVLEQKEKNILEINIKMLKKGVYIVEIENENNVIKKKFIKD